MNPFSLSRVLTIAGLLLALLGVGGLTRARAADLATAPVPVPAATDLSINPAKQVQVVQAGQTYAYYYK